MTTPDAALDYTAASIARSARSMRMYWNGERGFSEISDTRTSSATYRTDHHVNHIHTELSVDGAARRTRFFTEGAPPVTCPVVCYGSAAVREDRSFVDCALSGEMCLPSPPRCGMPAPPEPSEAARNAGAALPAVTPLAALSSFNFVPSQRMFDTRTPSESTRLVRSDGATRGPLHGARTGTFSDWAGLPGGATSVWLNVAAVPLTAPASSRRSRRDQCRAHRRSTSIHRACARTRRRLRSVPAMV